MAFQPVPDTAQLQFHLVGTSGGPLAGLNWYFNLYCRDTTTAWGATELQKLADYGQAWNQAGKDGGQPLRNLYTSEWTMQSISAKDLETANGLVANAVVSFPAGLKTPPNAPPSVPAIVQFRGDPGGAPKLGRVFWSGLAESDLDGDRYGTSILTTLAQTFTNFRNDLNDPTAGGTATWAQVLVSRNFGTTPDPTPKRVSVRRATAVTNTLGPPITARLVVGAQRNRREGE